MRNPFRNLMRPRIADEAAQLREQMGELAANIEADLGDHIIGPTSPASPFTKPAPVPVVCQTCGTFVETSKAALVTTLTAVYFDNNTKYVRGLTFERFCQSCDPKCGIRIRLVNKGEDTLDELRLAARDWMLIPLDDEGEDRLIFNLTEAEALWCTQCGNEVEAGRCDDCVKTTKKSRKKVRR